MNEIVNSDCMDGMRDYPDKFFELAIVDPPYGIKVDSMTMGRGSGNDLGLFKKKGWDDHTPDESYFLLLKRKSINQIIWGGNYFINYLENTPCLIIWDKLDYNSDFAAAEIAWASFGTVTKIFRHARNTKEKRIHPTQKPIALYKWLLTNYSKEGEKILDTHLGSGSSVIACLELGFEYMAYELDKDYYDAAVKRVDAYKRQLKLF